MKLDEIQIGHVYSYQYTDDLSENKRYCQIIGIDDFLDCLIVINPNGKKYRISSATNFEYVGEYFPEEIKPKEIKNGDFWILGGDDEN